MTANDRLTARMLPDDEQCPWFELDYDSEPLERCLQATLDGLQLCQSTSENVDVVNMLDLLHELNVKLLSRVKAGEYCSPPDIIEVAKKVRARMRCVETTFGLIFPLEARLRVALDAIELGLATNQPLESAVGYLMLRDLLDPTAGQ